MSYLKYDKEDTIENFNLTDSNGKNVFLNDFSAKYKVLYFYPKDNTKGCTTEALDFTALSEEFNNYNAVIIGISPDEPKKHISFITKNDLKINLLSDPEKNILEKFGVWQEKSMYGKKYFGVVRTTVLLSESNKIIEIWEKVKVTGHAEAVLNYIKNLK